MVNGISSEHLEDNKEQQYAFGKPVDSKNRKYVFGKVNVIGTSFVYSPNKGQSGT